MISMRFFHFGAFLFLFVFSICESMELSRLHISQGWEQLPDSPDPKEKMSISFFLPQRNEEALEKAFWKISDPDDPEFRKFLTGEEIRELMRASPAHFQEVSQFITSLHPSLIRECNKGIDWIKCRFPVGVVEKAFQTKIRAFRHRSWGDDRQIFRSHPAFPPTIHPTISHTVDFVHGLTDFVADTKFSAKTESHFHTKTDSPHPYSSMADIPMTPGVFADLYGSELKNNPKGSLRQKTNNGPPPMGIAGFGDQFSLGNLFSFRMLFGLEWDIDTLSQDGKMNATGWDIPSGESDLDMQWITAIGGVDQHIEFREMDNGKWILDWATEVMADVDVAPRVISLSYGFPESFTCGLMSPGGCPNPANESQYITRCNSYIKAMGINGISVFVSSGDRGAPSFSGYCPVDPEIQPGGCPYEEGCGCSSLKLESPLGAVLFPNAQYDPMAMVDAFDMYAGYAGACEDFFYCQYLLFYPGAFMLLSQLFPESNCSQATAKAMQVLNDSHVTKEQRCGGQFTDSWFVSNCSCDTLPTITVGDCSMSGYTPLDFEKYPVFLTSFPGDSPYVTCVGATQFPLVSPPYDSAPEEIVASIKTAAWITPGGGFSRMQNQPSYQQAAVQKYLKQQEKAGNLPPKGTYDPKMRAYPDVSLIGHHYPVVSGQFDGGITTAMDGTSASTPAFAGFISVLNQKLIAKGQPTVGFLNPSLYKMAADPSSGAFFDITSGDINCAEDYCCEYGFSASPGWDPASGLGSPRFPGFLTFFLKENSTHSTQEPPHSTQEPPHSTQEPPHSTQEPPHSTQEPPHSTHSHPPSESTGEGSYSNSYSETTQPSGSGTFEIFSKWLLPLLTSVVGFTIFACS